MKSTQKLKELRDMSIEELLDEYNKLKKAHFDLRMRVATNQHDNVAEVRNTKREIAQLLTVFKERYPDRKIVG
jgi:ribosomal protein L29